MDFYNRPFAFWKESIVKQCTTHWRSAVNISPNAIKHMHNFQSFMDVNYFTVFIYKILKIAKVYPRQLNLKYVLGCLPLLPILRKCVHWLVPVIISSINWFKQQWVTDWLFLKLAPMVMWMDPVARKARQMLFFN